MEKHMSMGELVTALAKAKGSIESPKKTKTGKVSGVTKTGKHDYEYKYADRQDVIEAYQKALSDNGLALSHSVDVVGEGLNMVLVSRLIHTSGAELVSRIPIPQTKDAQSLGSWLTYLERYAACALLDIAGQEDDDGRAAVRRKSEEKRAEEKPKPAGPVITAEDVSRVFAAAKAVGITTPRELRPRLRAWAGVESASDIPADKLEHVLEQITLVNAPDEVPA